MFRQTSTLIQMVSTFGLELEVQLSSVFQVYVTVGPQFRGQTRGEPLPRQLPLHPAAPSRGEGAEQSRALTRRASARGFQALAGSL